MYAAVFLDKNTHSLQEMRFTDCSYLLCWSVLQEQGRTQHTGSGIQVHIISGSLCIKHYVTNIEIHVHNHENTLYSPTSLATFKLYIFP